jgi:hypothetical protein
MEEWITEHWATLLAALGLGGGGSVVGHKMVDKIQNKKIEKLEAKVNEMDSSFKVNDGVDKQFRKEVDTRLGNIETSLMHLTLYRFSESKESTIGLLYQGKYFVCFTLEDQFQKVKVEGETRIPEGKYKIKQRRVLSGLTKKYRAKYPWFDYHFELQDVPNFKYVYLHVGNDDNHTDGCILIGDRLKSNKVDDVNNLGASGPAFSRLYKRMKDAFTVDIDIINISSGPESAWPRATTP